MNEQYLYALNLPVVSLEWVSDGTLSGTKESNFFYIPGEGDQYGAGQCVLYVRYITGLNYSGDAKWWKEYRTSIAPSVGSVIVMNLGSVGHVGIVISIDEEDNTVTVRSRNYRGRYIVSDDVFSIDDPSILGYIDY